MKKTFLSIVVLLFTFAALTGCSKDSTLVPGNENLVTADAGKTGFPNDQTGIITGVIHAPKLFPVIMLYHPSGEWGPYYPEYSSGIFKIPGIPAGVYKMLVTASDVNSPTDTPGSGIQVSLEVIVKPGGVTNVGVINL